MYSILKYQLKEMKEKRIPIKMKEKRQKIIISIKM
jgi:hypothetical protein